MKKIIFLFISSIFSITTYSQPIYLRCPVTGVVTYYQTGNTRKLEPATVAVTIETIKGFHFVEIAGNSDYTFTVDTSTDFGKDKTMRKDVRDFSDENKYVIYSRISNSSSPMGQNFISLNRITGILNYKIELFNGNEKFYEKEVTGECVKFSNSKRF